MSYDEEGGLEERSFRINDDNEDEPLEIPEEITDFGLDEEDPEKDR